jgi:hypothetical protein
MSDAQTRPQIRREEAIEGCARHCQESGEVQPPKRA